MTRGPKPAFRANRTIILAQEKDWATSTAFGLRKQKQITVWEVLMPVLLIFNFARAKVDRETFVQNLLFTKNLALEAALKMVEQGLDKAQALVPARKRTKELLASVGEEIYSKAIRERQLEEMELLIDHYSILLQARGSDFPSLVRDCYADREAFASFLESLKEAEKAVSQASLETLGPRGNPSYVARIEGLLDSCRSKSVDQAFGPGSHA